MSDLRELFERLERLKGPTRDADRAIAEAIGWRRKQADALGRCLYTRADSHGPHYLPKFTSSIDAKLPGEFIVGMHVTVDGWEATALSAPPWMELHRGFSKVNEAVARRVAALHARAAAHEKTQISQSPPDSDTHRSQKDAS